MTVISCITRTSIDASHLVPVTWASAFCIFLTLINAFKHVRSTVCFTFVLEIRISENVLQFWNWWQWCGPSCGWLQIGEHGQNGHQHLIAVTNTFCFQHQYRLNIFSYFTYGQLLTAAGNDSAFSIANVKTHFKSKRYGNSIFGSNFWFGSLGTTLT